MLFSLCYPKPQYCPFWEVCWYCKCITLVYMSKTPLPSIVQCVCKFCVVFNFISRFWCLRKVCVVLCLLAFSVKCVSNFCVKHISVLSSVVSSLWDVSGMFLIFSVVSTCPSDFCKKELLPSSSLITIATSLPSSLSLTLVFLSSEHGPVVFWCPSLFRGYSSLGFFMTRFLRVKMLSSRVIFFMSWRTPLPSILRSTVNIPPWVLSNMCLAKNFSRWDGCVSCDCLEVDESRPSVDTVFNWVSAIKWNIYVNNVVMVGHIFCWMLLLRKHKDTFVGFTHC